MQQVIEDHDPIIITRQNEESVVMISLADYNALMETNHLLRSPANARRLLASIAQDRAGQVHVVDVPEH
jgi:antitoxin YefM